MIWFFDTRSNSVKYFSGGQFIPSLVRMILAIVFRILANLLLLTIDVQPIRRVNDCQVKRIVRQTLQHIHAIGLYQRDAVALYGSRFTLFHRLSLCHQETCSIAP